MSFYEGIRFTPAEIAAQAKAANAHVRRLSILSASPPGPPLRETIAELRKAGTGKTLRWLSWLGISSGRRRSAPSAKMRDRGIYPTPKGLQDYRHHGRTW